MKRSCLAVMVLVSVALSARAGWYFETKTTGEGGGGQAHSDMMNSVAKTWIDGDKLKSEFVESKNPILPSGSYIVSTNGGASLTLVNPAQKSYAPFDVAGLAGGAMKMLGDMMKISEPKVEKLLDEDGGKLLGHPVRHYKFRTTYNMEMNMVIMKSNSRIETIQEIWTATRINDAGSSFWRNKNSFSTGDENFDKLMKSEMEKIQGLPLKQITLTRTTDQNGTVNENKMIMEVTALNEQKVADSLFAVPAEYSEIPFMSMGAEAGAAQGAGKRGQAPRMDPNALMEMMKKMQSPQAK